MYYNYLVKINFQGLDNLNMKEKDEQLSISNNSDEDHHEFDHLADEEDEDESQRVIKQTILTQEEKENETTQLVQDLDDLRTLFQLPLLYLSNFFTDLKRDIDLAAMKHSLNISPENTEQQMSLNKTWVSLVDKVNEFETNCYQAGRVNKLSSALGHQVQDLIDLIETRIKNLKSKEDVNEINELIYEKLYELEKIVFMNKTITFVEKSECLISELFSEMEVKVSFGKLIIVTNEYLGKRGLNFLTK